MSKVRFYIAMAAAKTAHRLLRLCGRAATHTPGAVATKLCPDFLRYLQKPETLICVTGTDGKTTVSNLLATVLQNNGYTVTNNSYGSRMQRFRANRKSRSACLKLTSAVRSKSINI